MSSSDNAEEDVITSCTVLVIDDDEACLHEYCEIIASFGYGHRSAKSAREALVALAEDKEIGIVVTDFQMPDMDGMTLLAEIDARYTTARPIVTLMVTGFSSLQTAVDAMRQNAVDFLAKPIERDELASALRRASVRRAQFLGLWKLSAMQSAAAKSEHPQDFSREVSGDDLKDFVRNIILLRRKRLDYLDQELFSDPAWDILLELTMAKLENTPIPMSSACAATQVPFSTAFRHVGNLVASGLIRRRKDGSDNRRVMLELEDDTHAAMLAYLTSIKG
jgi:CheY-like chemotaxis protein/DNA-binding MarR family transcriptional regulator